MSDIRQPPSPQKIRQINKPMVPTQSQIQKAQRRDSLLTAEQNQAFNTDGWANVMTGLGGNMDKRAYNFYGRYPVIPDPELERIYFGDGIGARVVDVVADDMTREWITLKTIEEDDQAEENESLEDEAIKTVMESLEELDAQSVFNEAIKWARLYGGAAIIMGVLDGQPLDAPMNVNRITGFDYLRVIDRTDIDLFQSVYQNDPEKPGFGKPELFFMYFQVGVMRYPKMVHVSRVIMLKGKKIPTGATPTTTLQQRFWGLSVFNGLYEALSDYASNMDSVTNVLAEFVVGKFKMNGLSQMMAEGKEALVQNRMQLISLMKSVIHAVMLDSENEDYTRDTVSLTGIAELIDRSALKICAVTGIPYTRLFGDSPGGLSTDDSMGKATYYDMVRGAQHTQLKPAIRRLVDIILAWKKVTLPLEIEFNPLLSLDEVQQADVELKNSQTELNQANEYAVYIQNGVLDAEQVHTLKWKERLEGVEVYSLGPGAEAEGEELEPALEQEVEKASTKNQVQTGTASPAQGLVSKAGIVQAGGQGVGPDVIGKGLG